MSFKITFYKRMLVELCGIAKKIELGLIVKSWYPIKNAPKITK